VATAWAAWQVLKMDHPTWSDPITYFYLVAALVIVTGSLVFIVGFFALVYKAIMHHFGIETPMLDRFVSWIVRARRNTQQPADPPEWSC
jgi:hypothetical protein